MKIEWLTAWFCVDCKGELSTREKYYSHGRCPRCGHKGDHAETIVETYERAYYQTRKYWWWPFSHNRWFK